MRLAGFTKRWAWPVAMAFAAGLALAALGGVPEPARAEPKEYRKKAQPPPRGPNARRSGPKEHAQGGPKRGQEGRPKDQGERRRAVDGERRKDRDARTKDREKGETRTRERDNRDRKDARKKDGDRKETRSRDRDGRDGKDARRSSERRSAARELRIDRSFRRSVNARTPRLRQAERATHRTALFAARERIPMRPYPGERGFTGVPPREERRFITTELVFQAGPNVTQQQIDEMARRHNCVAVGTQRSSLTGGTLIRFRIAGSQDAADMVRAMEGEQLGIAQPNYLYEAAAPAAQPAAQASSEQYVTDKLKLAAVHRVATGKGVLIAVIDSQIDASHPELSGAIAETFEAIGAPDKPHTHGTGMLGAIVSRGRLMGIAPDARALAIHAFATGTRQTPQATTQAIIAGLEFAVEKGARIINMSFAGPSDPMLQVALKKAAERGIVLIAAAGNAGPKSPPLYPAADRHVIGVTATDQNDAPYPEANRGPYVAVAAPGVNIIAPAPDQAYQLTTGTSVAAAHVSGVAALLLERHPEADPAIILEVLTASATKLTKDDRNDQVGYGLIDPAAALAELDERMAKGGVAVSSTTPSAQPAEAKPPARSAATPAPAPAAATTKKLPRPTKLPAARAD